eukprot:s1653_g6.t1
MSVLNIQRCLVLDGKMVAFRGAHVGKLRSVTAGSVMGASGSIGLHRCFSLGAGCGHLWRVIMSAGNLEEDLKNGQVIWRVPAAECSRVARDQWLSRDVDFLGVQLKLELYPKGCQQHSSASRAVLRLENPANARLTCRVTWNELHTDDACVGTDYYQQYHSEINGTDVQITIELVCLNGKYWSDSLIGFMECELDKEKRSREIAQGDAQRLGAELAKEKKCREESEAEINRLQTLIAAGGHHATERARRLARSAVRIQAKWRQVLTRRWVLRERSEKDRRLKQAKRVRTITVLQRLWRLKQKKCQCRWLQAKNGSEVQTPYDAILAFHSLAQFLKEGKIDFLQKAESQLQIAKESRYRIVAVVGLFDKGKTWLLNKLFGANLPAGKLCTTKGLSFLWIKERRMLVLDSAGVQSTVSYRAQAVDAIHDAQTTESLMFEMMSRISHHMLFVVNDLTWFEQKYVAMLHQKYVQCKKHKELIVVHNLRNTLDVAEATKLFRRQVMQCYDGELSHLGDLIFTADLGDGVPPVHHVGLCHEFSKAGDAFNAKNREYLLHSLEHGNTLGTNIVLTDLLSLELSRLLPKFVNIESSELEASGGPAEQAVSVNVFDKLIGTGVLRFIRIECPGIVEEEIEWQELPNGVKVTINKKPPIEEHAVQPVEPIRQHHGVWERDFLFDPTEGRFELCEKEATLEHGVLTMVLKLLGCHSLGIVRDQSLLAELHRPLHQIAPVSEVASEAASSWLRWRSRSECAEALAKNQSTLQHPWAVAMSTSECRGTLKMDYLNAKVVWTLKKIEYEGLVHGQSVSQHVDFLGWQFKLRFWPEGLDDGTGPTGSTLPEIGLCPCSHKIVDIHLWFEKQKFGTTIVPGKWEQFRCQSHIQEEDVELVIDVLKVSNQSVTEALPKFLASKLEEVQRENEHLWALINAGNHQAAERECRLIRSAVKIQAKLRQVMIRRRFLREVAEREVAEAKWLRGQKSCADPETPYDAILAFDSLAEFLKEGKIDFLQKAESHLEVAKESRYRIIAVVGLFDKGKTWLLNKLFGANLPAGKLCTTKGLSFLWIKERRMLVLDSAGVQSTVSYRAQAVDAIHDAQTTESLMFEMVSRISHHMVFVVNDLTWFEQKYVAMLHQKYVQCKQHKELIVVHNLRNTSDVAEATMLFSRQVMQCYDGEQSHLGDLIFTADLGEGVPPVHHIGLCFEFSKAGEEFNAKNRDYLLQSLEHGNTLGTNIVLTALLSSELSRLLPKFVNIETIEPEASGTVPEQPVQVTFESSKDKAATPNVEGTCYTSSGSFCMRLSHEKARVTTKTRGVISPLGEIIAHDVSFDPIVNVFDKPIDCGLQRTIRIECPGVVDDDIEYEELANGVKVTINKKPPIEEHAVQPVEPIRQHHGVWERDFLFDPTEGRFELCDDEATLENGVLTMVLKKAMQPRKGRLGKARARRSQAYEGPCRVASPTASDCTSVVVVSEVASEAANRKLAAMA